MSVVVYFCMSDGMCVTNFKVGHEAFSKSAVRCMILDCWKPRFLVKNVDGYIQSTGLGADCKMKYNSGNNCSIMETRGK